MKLISKEWSEIPFAHRQPLHTGHCQHIHGHNWSIRLTMTATELDVNGFVVDFGGLKSIKEWIDVNLDHACVLTEDDPFVSSVAFREMIQNKVLKPFIVKDASAEGLAQLFFETFSAHVKKASNGRARIIKVEVVEDSRNLAIYTA